MKVHNELIQGSDAWLNLRVGKFGGSDAHTVSVNGKGLETLCFQKASEIEIGRPPENYTNSDMERGNTFEDTARIIYEMQTENLVEKVGYIELSERVGVSPDGLVGDDGGIEIKCPNDYKFVKFLYEKKNDPINAIENKHYYQMQHLMYVADRKWCDYVIFNQNLDKIDITRVDRDEEAIKKIEKGLTDGIKRINKILEEIRRE